MYTVLRNSRIWEFSNLELAIGKFISEYSKAVAMDVSEMEEMNVDIRATLARKIDSYAIMANDQSFALTKVSDEPNSDSPSN